jgi:hypothetical protein
MKEKDLEGVKIMGIHMMSQEDKKIIMFDTFDKESSEKLYKLLTENTIRISALIDKEQKYSVAVEFTDIDFGFVHPTGFTKDEYPPLTWLSNQQVTHLTTGYWDELSKSRQYNTPFHSIENLIHLN